METINVTPWLKGWMIYKPNRVTEELIEKLTNTYKQTAPTSKGDEVDLMIIEGKLEPLLEKRELAREFKTHDGYTWAITAEFSPCPGLLSRLKILFPYKSKDEEKLDRPLAIYVHGQVWQKYISQLLRKITNKLNELKLFV